ncbi:MAG: tRNA uridine-5-carboxymethylaminomethyl(34) synthesis GTPase MnmE [Candidatus Dadabacteria bacterium]|nr:tRNA uridine-5-carboxymethylaminomethyl(34) synthesis GTPase MnmE [Candidatus Dadabacteria bacterium]NIS09025.1 tRNA uridine-5-carboxymethylaminomethyl(34) synthesis GTPase MnmE [Candidatus Dadabacteria bacterium]NIX15619.1 tRNA uridine-5-carboxymethylaminomethyl(34) synthesis GTPase MnmE [Candidatus Dadabacteria bacterium]NIY22361.1 tRNA uridine-5-carboxymethylaminomethyl(34) synthesis GTPase MnmE [Candidatus Dadabacteria bacterium]
MSRDIFNEDTIAAIATAEGHAGIAIIRISGSEAVSVLKSIFKRTNDKPIEQIKPFRFYRGFIVADNEDRVVDDVLVVYMKSPKSYTGQDVIEIHCHGGALVSKIILDLCIKNGARTAEPGEFTLRAFLNNKMDLSQAEAVADVINSQTEKSLKLSQMQLEGQLSRQIGEYKELVLDMLAEIEANVDFPEEGLDPLVKDRILESSQSLITKLEKLISSFEQGHILKHGVTTAILGKPNVGKSSLLNCLLRKDRALVSEAPGTTRDFIEETIDINGIALKLVDTAGIRLTDEHVESMGINISRKKSQEAEFQIVVLDISHTLNKDDHEVIGLIKDSNYIIVLNKNDLGMKISSDDLPDNISKDQVIEISAKKNINIDELRDKISKIITGDRGSAESSSVIISELRHKNSLEQALESLARFKKALETDESPEYLAVDLRYALDKFGEITGEITSEDVLSRIFSRFCIGK